MAGTDGLPGPEASAQGWGDHEHIDALLQRLADFVQDLNRRAESRQSQVEQDKSEQDRQSLRQLFARWEQEDARRKESGYDPQREEYERRMKEQDARIDENMREIRRRLDALERRWDKTKGAGEPPPEG